MNIKLFLVAMLAGLPGVAAVVMLVLPGLLASRQLPIPLWVALLASAGQSALLLAGAVFTGVVLARRVGLSAPGLSAFAESKPIISALRPQVIPGLLGGLVGGALLWSFSRYAPEALAQLQARFIIPPLARVLYGGVTEELLVRWGLMTLIAWLFWRVFQNGRGTPSSAIMYSAISVSAVAFGAGHLPAVYALLGHVPTSVAIFVVVANAAFGFMAGWLYWQFGLESAILAHALSHALVLVASQ